MNKQLKIFFDKLSDDQSLKEKMAGCKSAEEAYRVASEVEGGFTLEEFQKAMEMAQKATQQDSELSENDLEGVAGGIDTTTWVAIGVGIGAPAAAAAM